MSWFLAVSRATVRSKPRKHGPAQRPATATPPDVVASAPSAGLIHLRRVANWANGSTPLGMVIASAGGAELRGGPWGLHLASNYRWRFPVASAFTVGDVVISRHDLMAMSQRRPGLLEHEEAHARQWMACLGLPFLPLYLASMGWSWLRTGDRAAYCVFERHADLAKGGYAEVPARPIAPVLRQAGRRMREAVLAARKPHRTPGGTGPVPS